MLRGQSNQGNLYPYIGDKPIEEARLAILASLYDGNSTTWLSEYLKEGDKALEIGSGTGKMARNIKGVIGEKGDYTGLEINQGHIDTARAEAPSLRFIAGDALETSKTLEVGSYDVVYFRWFLWILPELDQITLLQQLYDLLKPGGYLLAEEADITTTQCKPMHASMAEYKQLVAARCELRGHPMQLGKDMGALCEKALSKKACCVKFFQPVASSSEQKSLPLLGLASSKEALLETGVTEQQLKKLEADIKNNSR